MRWRESSLHAPEFYTGSRWEQIRAHVSFQHGTSTLDLGSGTHQVVKVSHLSVVGKERERSLVLVSTLSLGEEMLDTLLQRSPNQIPISVFISPKQQHTDHTMHPSAPRKTISIINAALTHNCMSICPSITASPCQTSKPLSCFNSKYGATSLGAAEQVANESDLIFRIPCVLYNGHAPAASSSPHLA